MPMNKNRIEGVAEQGERANGREAFVTEFCGTVEGMLFDIVSGHALNALFTVFDGYGLSYG